MIKELKNKKALYTIKCCGCGKELIYLFKHEKILFHPVSVERPNPQYAALLKEQLGGGNGEMKAAMQYMSQSFRRRIGTYGDGRANN